jgi:hypothetical protein
VTFVTLCKAYLGIDPEFDLWNYFFRVRRPQDPKAKLMVSEGAVIHVKSGHGIDPYLDIPMPSLMKRERCRRMGHEKAGGGDPLDLGPLMRGK